MKKGCFVIFLSSVVIALSGCLSVFEKQHDAGQFARKNLSSSCKECENDFLDCEKKVSQRLSGCVGEGCFEMSQTASQTECVLPHKKCWTSVCESSKSCLEECYLKGEGKTDLPLLQDKCRKQCVVTS